MRPLTVALAAALLGGAPVPAAPGTPLPDPAAVLAAVNRVRKDPAGYAGVLRGLARGFSGPQWAEADGVPHSSFEGAPAVLAAAAAMDATAPMPALAPDPVLRAAARAHALAQGPTGAIGHASAAGATPGERVRRAGGDVFVAEVIAYAMHDADDVVRDLVVDDGLPGRGHRRLLLAPFYRYAGIWCAPHAGQGTECVIDLAATPGARPAVPAE